MSLGRRAGLRRRRLRPAGPWAERRRIERVGQREFACERRPEAGSPQPPRAEGCSVGCASIAPPLAAARPAKSRVLFFAVAARRLFESEFRA